MKKAIRFLIPVALALLILVSIFWYLFDYDRVFTRDTLLSQARFHDLNGNSRLSSWFYTLAYNFSGHDQDVAIELASQYRADGNFTKAEATLTQAVRAIPSAKTYGVLCETYVAQDKLLDAVRLLDGITDPAIAAELAAKRPAAPTADSAPGFYSQYIDVHLAAPSGTIYYTTDGTYPTTAGPVYEDGIHLPSGVTKIQAITVGDDGLVSPVVTLDYTITGVVERVELVDKAVEEALRQQIQAGATETLYTNMLWEVREFIVPEEAAVLDDIKYLSHLESLTVQGKTIASLDFLSDLESLKTLDLTSCDLPSEALSVLAELPNLTSLTLSDCSLSTITPLASAQKLSYLDLSKNTIRNLDVLKPMVTLTELNLQHNALTDLSALSGLSGLKILNVGFNSVTSLKPLSSIGALTWLDASENSISDCSALSSLPMLQYLDLRKNALTDISPLSACTQLTELNISDNQIGTILPLLPLTKLEVFNFSGNIQIAELPAWPDGCPLRVIDGSTNALTSIDTLRNMQSLTHVYMDYNALTNIDALADCYCLVQVNVFGNQITDVSALRERDILVNYDPTVKDD